jgi:hypothetical protein
VTQFQIVGLEKSVIVELGTQAVKSCMLTTETDKVSLREEMIMKKYMLICLKHIKKVTYSKGMALT